MNRSIELSLSLKRVEAVKLTALSIFFFFKDKLEENYTQLKREEHLTLQDPGILMNRSIELSLSLKQVKTVKLTALSIFFFFFFKTN